ncbi:MAG: Fe-S cluster assembly protein SufB [Candidatus Aenigmarchaeota archaeon]|nr:Fe-S cluster assembly protein SufB [Candidatus Aenigmarchaeota archaeon]
MKKHEDLFRRFFSTVVPPEDNKFAALNSAVWSGGCLTADSLIFTANPGAKPISEIESDDIVYALSDTGKIEPAKVVAKIYSGKKEVYKLLAGGRAIRATANHMFLCAQKSEKRLNEHGKRWHTIWKPLGELREGDIIAIAKKIPDNGKSKSLPKLKRYIKNRQHETIMVPEKTDENLMWFLGLWLGDGCTYFPTAHMCQINLALPKVDPVREEAIKIIRKLFGYKVVTQNENSITIYSKALGLWLKDIYFFGKAKTKRLPQWVFGLPLSQRLALLGGLLDTDGCIENKGKIIRFELSNQGLVEDIKMLAISCGLFSGGKILKRNRQAAFFKREKRKIYSGTSYSCRITGNLRIVPTRNPEKISKLINSQKSTFDKYSTITGENLSTLANEWLGFAPIREKSFIGVEDVYDIQVEKHANFVANGIIAHNSFIYVPPGVKVDLPLQAYFRINAQNMGQFERTLIIADKNSSVSYLEGCTAPVYATDSLHSAVVELIAMEGARLRYTTIQNWSANVYNLVTKRAYAYKDAIVEWIDGNIGSKLTMKYPSVFLLEPGARADILSVAYAGKGQHQDAGGKAVHLAPNTSSTILSKSVSKDGGRTTYRGLLKVAPGATNVKSNVRCDALILDEKSASDTVPYMEIEEKNVSVGHEATVGKISDEQLFYLMSRGLTEQEAMTMIVSGFIEPFTKELPLEYAVELNRLIQLEMAGAVG